MIPSVLELPIDIATTGLIACEPDAANVVHQLARLVIDAHSNDQRKLDRFIAAIDRASAQAATASYVARQRFSLLSRSTPVVCDEKLRRRLANAAAELGLSSIDMVSGAGHDGSFLSSVAPMAMIFVPSRDGKSHSPKEWTECNQVAAARRGFTRQ